jgi:glycosyltransferase involved in cell wall biosynthesis
MVFVVSEVYYPEEAGTAHFMTGIAEGLARRIAVKVFCAKPKYDGDWHDLPRREIRGGVEIERCWATTFDKNWLPGRIANALTSTLSIFVRILVRVRSGDAVLVVTTPPSLPVLVALACVIRRAKCFLRVDGVYPEAMIHAGVIRPGGLAALLINGVNRILCRRVDAIVVLGRDMRCLVEKRFNGPSSKIVVVPSWADVDLLVPTERQGNKLLRQYGLEDRFVVGYAGNIGRVQAVEALLEADRNGIPG